MGFKSDFYKLVDKYKTLPYSDDQMIIGKGKKTYRLILEIQEITGSHAEPTHKDSKSMIEYMASQKDAIWVACDNPKNDPPLVQFMDEKDPSVDGPLMCSVALANTRMLSREILKEVEILRNPLPRK